MKKLILFMCVLLAFSFSVTAADTTFACVTQGFLNDLLQDGNYSIAGEWNVSGAVDTPQLCISGECYTDWSSTPGGGGGGATDLSNYLNLTQDHQISGQNNFSNSAYLNYSSCSALETDAGGLIVCGTDDTGVGGTDLSNYLNLTENHTITGNNTLTSLTEIYDVIIHQFSRLIHFNNLTGVPDYNETIVITESQISDLSHTVDTDTIFSNVEYVNVSMLQNSTLIRDNNVSWIHDNEQNPSNASIEITESQISDLSHTVDTDTNRTDEDIFNVVNNNTFVLINNVSAYKVDNSTYAGTAGNASQVHCSDIVGGSDGDHCIDATEAGGTDLGNYLNLTNNHTVSGNNTLTFLTEIYDVIIHQFSRLIHFNNLTGVPDYNETIVITESQISDLSHTVDTDTIFSNVEYINTTMLSNSTLIRDTNVSWITSNQEQTGNTTDQIFGVVNNGTFVKENTNATFNNLTIETKIVNTRNTNYIEFTNDGDIVIWI